MAKMNLTPDQQKVVDASHCSTLVAAAAGSGKTAVLVKRIMRRLMDSSTSLDRLLIVTFTKAAAAEMKERIGKALTKALSEDPENKLLHEQLANLDAARISTIDSFCMTVVKENFQALPEEMDIDPGFAIGDENELSLLMDKVMDELFEDEYEQNREGFINLLRAFGTYKDDSKVKSIIRSVYAFADTTPRPEVFYANVRGSFEQDLSEKPFIRGLYKEVRERLECAIAEADGLLEFLEQNAAPEKYTDNVTQDINIMEGILPSIVDNDSARIGLNSLSWDSLSRKKDDFPENLKEIFKSRRDAYRKNVGSFAGVYFSTPASEENFVYKQTEPYILEILSLVDKFTQRLLEAKKEQNLYSFSDVEHMAHHILCKRENNHEVPTEVAGELCNGYDEIMIDEYQDSSYLQEEILYSISGETCGNPNMFMVGDIKQSIYAFRQACPEIFNGKYETFQDKGAHRKIDLHMNFRSRKSVLDAINVSLAPIMRKNLAEIDYDELAALYFGQNCYPADTAANNTELVILDKNVAKEEQQRIEAIFDYYKALDPVDDMVLGGGNTTDMEREALWVGLRIKKMIKEGFLVSEEAGDKEQYSMRPCTFRDFAVLGSAGKKMADTYTSVFRRLGIPASAETGRGFYDALEVKKTIAYLRALDNPYADIPFASIVYSYFGGFNEEEFAELRAKYDQKILVTKDGKPVEKQTSIYECVRNAASAGNVKAMAFLGEYDRLRRVTKRLSVSEIVRTVAEETGFIDHVTTMPGGDVRRGNIEKLIKTAEKFEKGSYANLHEFLQYIRLLQEADKDEGVAGNEATGDQVNVLTIHKSKGLEYPIVFLVQMGHEFNDMDTKNPLIFDRDLGIGSNYVNINVPTLHKGVKVKTKRKTLLRAYMEMNMIEKARSEDIRKLYVALTRAREKLIMVGSVSDPASKIAKWVQNSPKSSALPFSGAYVDSAKTYFDYICPTILKDLQDGDKIGAFTDPSSRFHKYSADISSFCGKTQFTAPFDISFSSITEAEAQMQLTKGKEAGQQESMETTGLSLESPEVIEEIRKRKEFVYPFVEQASSPMRVSVSALKKIAIEELFGDEIEHSPIMPSVNVEEASDGEKKLSGAEKGTIYHEVFEKLRYNGNYDTYEEALKSVEQDVNGLIADGFLEPSVLSVIDLNKYAAFTMSDIGKKFIEANKEGRLHREQPFVYGLSKEEYQKYSHTDQDTEMVMVQGIIDAFVDEKDTIILVDYKTDRVYNDVNMLKDRYKVQLMLYSEALSHMLGKPVTHRIIWSVFSDKEVEI